MITFKQFARTQLRMFLLDNMQYGYSYDLEEQYANKRYYIVGEYYRRKHKSDIWIPLMYSSSQLKEAVEINRVELTEILVEEIAQGRPSIAPPFLKGLLKSAFRLTFQKLIDIKVHKTRDEHYKTIVTMRFTIRGDTPYEVVVTWDGSMDPNDTRLLDVSTARARAEYEDYLLGKLSRGEDLWS